MISEVVYFKFFFQNAVEKGNIGEMVIMKKKFLNPWQLCCSRLKNTHLSGIDFSIVDFLFVSKGQFRVIRRRVPPPWMFTLNWFGTPTCPGCPSGLVSFWLHQLNVYIGIIWNGGTFLPITLDQFERNKDKDRFFFIRCNIRLVGGFSKTVKLILIKRNLQTLAKQRQTFKLSKKFG